MHFLHRGLGYFDKFLGVWCYWYHFKFIISFFFLIFIISKSQFLNISWRYQKNFFSIDIIKEWHNKMCSYSQLAVIFSTMSCMNKFIFSNRISLHFCPSCISILLSGVIFYENNSLNFFTSSLLATNYWSRNYI